MGDKPLEMRLGNSEVLAVEGVRKFAVVQQHGKLFLYAGEITNGGDTYEHGSVADRLSPGSLKMSGGTIARNNGTLVLDGRSMPMGPTPRVALEGFKAVLEGAYEGVEVIAKPYKFDTSSPQAKDKVERWQAVGLPFDDMRRYRDAV